MPTTNKHLLKIPVLISILLLITFSVSGAAPAARTERAAIVNGTIITQQALDRELEFFKERLREKGQEIPADKIEEARKSILENLITVRVLFQESQKKKIEVKDSEILEQIDAMKTQMPDPKNFQQALDQMKLTEAELKAKIGENLAARKLIEAEVERNIVVDESEVKAFYDSQSEMFLQPEMVRARHILIKVDQSADDAQRDEARKKIEAVEKRLAAGESFRLLAEEVSEGPSREKGGDLGYFQRGQMVKPFEDVAFTLNNGEISGIVTTRFGYHVIQTIDKKPSSPIPYDKIKDGLARHLKRNKTNAAIRAYIENLKGKAKIERFL
jgi:peptidyl-prolyl cis-trans isomerase C